MQQWIFHFPHHFILSEFRRKWTHVQNTIHCETWSSWIFLIICISELCSFFFFNVFCMDLVKERMLCTLLHCISILLKCEMKGLYIETNVSESTRWLFVVVFPFVLVMPPNISNVNHQYFEVRSECNGYKSLSFAVNDCMKEHYHSF